jgi:hypothetical protein
LDVQQIEISKDKERKLTIPMKPDMTFEQLLEASGPRDQCEVYSAKPNPGPDDELTWRVRLPGHGVYLGRADKYTDEHGEEFLAMADPHTFVPEN